MLSERQIYEAAQQGYRPELRYSSGPGITFAIVEVHGGYLLGDSGWFAPEHGKRVFRKAARLFEAAGGDPIH